MSPFALVRHDLWTHKSYTYCTLRGADLTARYASILDDADLEPLRNQAQDAFVRIEHAVHPPPQDAGVESVQRIVLAAPRREPIGKPDEVLLVDRLQNRRGP
jgi:hypothetical protein